MSWSLTVWRGRWAALSLGFAAVATSSLNCGGSAKPQVSEATSRPRVIAKTAVPGELAPPSRTAAPAPSATTVVIPVREQELREGFAARHYFVACYHEDLHRDRTANGHITLAFDVKPDGSLDKLEVTERTGSLSDKFVTCLTEGVLKVTLKPRPGSEPIRLTYPFAFSSEFHGAASASAKP